PEEYRDSNRMQAMDMVRKLQAKNYRIVKGGSPTDPVDPFTAQEVEEMARMEHDRWMKEKLAAGWTYGPERNNLLKIHDKLIAYDDLSERDKDMDRDPVRRIPEWLGKVGYGVVKGDQPK
ncbi:MAG: RyR domain-containing protein, partial [Flavobacteriales bacterium]